MVRGNKSSRGLKICCGVTALVIVILLLVAVVLTLTVFKPKNPKIITRSITLENVKYFPFPLLLNVTLGIEVTVDNPNHGSFKYENSTTYISYQGIEIARAPIEEDTIPARGKHDISTIVEIMGDKLVSNANFSAELLSGGPLNFTSSTTLHGKAIALKFLKIKATTYNYCEISVFVKAQNASSICSSKIKY